MYLSGIKGNKFSTLRARVKHDKRPQVVILGMIKTSAVIRRVHFKTATFLKLIMSVNCDKSEIFMGPSWRPAGRVFKWVQNFADF